MAVAVAYDGITGVNTFTSVYGLLFCNTSWYSISA